jgi:hypothetical protein
VPLDGFVAHLLHGHVRFEPERVVRPLDSLVAVTAPDQCRRCAAPFEHVVGVTNTAVGPPRYRNDGVLIIAQRDLWQDDHRQACAVIGGLGRLRRREPALYRPSASSALDLSSSRERVVSRLVMAKDARLSPAAGR